MILLLLKGISRFYCVLPLPVALAFGRGMGFLFGRVIRYHRNDALENVTRCFPELTGYEVKQLVNRMYANLGMNVAEALRISKFTKAYGKKYISVSGYENYEAVKETDRGCVALMAHIGNWETQGLLAQMKDLKLSVIVKSLKPPELNDYVVGLREATGLTVLNRKKAFRPALRSLKNKEIVSFILDQNVTRDDGVFVDFFGQPACTSSGLAILAIKTGSPVVPTFSVRRPAGHHEIFVLPAIEPPTEINDANVLALTQECTRVIEDFIREHPDQWIWLHRRWKTKALVSPETNDEVASLEN